jgi:DNA-binding MarR family transcriptional regulator
MKRTKKDQPTARSGTATFLLAQAGAHAALRFAERIAVLGLTPPHAGILRCIAGQPGISQRDLAERLGVLPSRLVALLDELEQSGYVERLPDPQDRRGHALQLKEAARVTLQQLGDIAREHEAEVLRALSPGERATLQALLERIARDQGLTPGVHPGFRRLGRKSKREAE